MARPRASTPDIASVSDGRFRAHGKSVYPLQRDALGREAGVQRNRQLGLGRLRAETDDALARERTQLQVRVALFAIGLQRALAAQARCVVGRMPQHVLDVRGGGHQPRALRAHGQQLIELFCVAGERPCARDAERLADAVDLDDERRDGGAQARKDHAAAADPDDGVFRRQLQAQQARIPDHGDAQHARHHQQRADGGDVRGAPDQPYRVQIFERHGAAQQVASAEQHCHGDQAPEPPRAVRFAQRRHKAEGRRRCGHRQRVAWVHAADPSGHPLAVQPCVHAPKIQPDRPAGDHLRYPQRGQQGHHAAEPPAHRIRPAHIRPYRADKQRRQPRAKQGQVDAGGKHDQQPIGADLHCPRPMPQPADHHGQPDKDEEKADAAG
ncbi:hypothetical protein COLO4_01254 [Corchorus olitorius]|uniref:Uncharacterized protein n=1 Tax=Corchorus olitorius TaxID=93759 RepID=A0A1R3L2R7_9ROSI|nr:hypothetical protein COLO4_01254 [Corchorus olitorius]